MKDCTSIDLWRLRFIYRDKNPSPNPVGIRASRWQRLANTPEINFTLKELAYKCNLQPTCSLLAHSSRQAYLGNTLFSQLTSKLGIAIAPLIPVNDPDGYHHSPCTYPDDLSAASLQLLSSYFCKLFPDQIQEMTWLHSKNNWQKLEIDLNPLNINTKEVHLIVHIMEVIIL